MIMFASLYRDVKDGNLVVNPAPVDSDTPKALWLANWISNEASTLAEYGYGSVLWPPLTMSQGRTANNADGYGCQFHLNVGQFPGQPTRWGSALIVQMANIRLHSLGIRIAEDTVTHQMDGGYPYYELGSNGKQDKTLFPKDANCFCPPSKQDVPFSSDGNQAFGDRTGFSYTTPKGYMLLGMCQAIAWRMEVFLLDDHRFDNGKGTNVAALKRFNAVGGRNFAEVWADINTLSAFVEQTGIAVLDFPFHWTLQGVCNNGVSLRTVPGSGFFSRNPSMSVEFVDSADTDNNDNENIKFNKLWAYALTLTVNARDAQVYNGDYSKYGLKKQINQMCWVSRMFAIGALSWVLTEDDLIVWQRDGDGGSYGYSGGLLCAFTRDPINVQKRWVPTVFGPNEHIQCYNGIGPDKWTNEYGWVELELGPNVNGSANNVVMYSKAGVKQKITNQPLPVVIKRSLTDFSTITARRTILDKAIEKITSLFDTDSIMRSVTQHIRANDSVVDSRRK